MVGLEIGAEGGDEFTRAIEAAIQGTIDSLIPPMVQEAETIMGRSKEIVPLDLGPLRASADEVGVNVDANENSVTVSFGYGGQAAGYSIIQHENPVFRHAPGRTWKYLENPTLEAIEGMEQRLAEGAAGNLSEETFDSSPTHRGTPRPPGIRSGGSGKTRVHNRGARGR